MRRVKVDIECLKAGMYIAQLDRPWLETPFMFQGFELRDKSELDLLGKYCRHVYIDIAKSSIRPEELERILSNKRYAAVVDLPKAEAARPSLKTRLLLFLSRFDRSGRLAQRASGARIYPVKTSLKKEVPAATQAYDVAVDVVNDVLDKVRNGGEIDVDQIRESISPMIQSVLRNPGAMSWFVLLKKRDSYAYNHSIASSVWATVLGRHLGLDKPTLDQLAIGGLLLDIGKAKLPQDLLQSEEVLSQADHRLIQQHVGIGLEIAKTMRGLSQEILDMIGSHHERHDGSGYPNALEGSDIPVYGRIAGLVDCYDAMTSNRPYAKAMSSYDAIRELNAMADKHFQKELVEQFVQALGMFPTGSVVELNTGEVGIVVEQNRVRRLRPKVMLILDSEKQPIKSHRTVDLRKSPSDSRNRKAKWIASGHESGAFGIDPAHYFIG